MAEFLIKAHTEHSDRRFTGVYFAINMTHAVNTIKYLVYKNKSGIIHIY